LPLNLLTGRRGATRQLIEQAFFNHNGIELLLTLEPLAMLRR
jgi:hypothetical protein